MERHHGFSLNRYTPADARPVTIWPTDGTVVAPFLSSVDNAWLEAGLTMVKNAEPALREQAQALIDGIDWSFFYDASKGHL